MISLTRIALPVILAMLMSTAAQAQAPGQIPGTLYPSVPVAPPPPMPVAPAPVPSVVTPLPQPSYGVPRGINAGPVYSSGVTPTIRYRQPKKSKKKRPRSSELLSIQAA